jgi:hypothetical protein
VIAGRLNCHDDNGLAFVPLGGNRSPSKHIPQTRRLPFQPVVCLLHGRNPLLGASDSGVG